jgi:hypothetical protein
MSLPWKREDVAEGAYDKIHIKKEESDNRVWKWPREPEAELDTYFLNSQQAQKHANDFQAPYNSVLSDKSHFSPGTMKKEDRGEGLSRRIMRDITNGILPSCIKSEGRSEDIGGSSVGPPNDILFARMLRNEKDLRRALDGMPNNPLPSDSIPVKKKKKTKTEKRRAKEGREANFSSARGLSSTVKPEQQPEASSKSSNSRHENKSKSRSTKDSRLAGKREEYSAPRGRDHRSRSPPQSRQLANKYRSSRSEPRKDETTTREIVDLKFLPRFDQINARLFANYVPLPKIEANNNQGTKSWKSKGTWRDYQDLDRVKKEEMEETELNYD